VLDAAGIAYASSEEDRARRGDLLQWNRSPDSGGSTWQSVTRGGSIETDFITGEIVRLGERVGVPTPANAVLLRRAHEVAEAGRGPGHDDPAGILAAAGY
jgi:2-dehydropantoate 2-reductase